MFVSIFQNKEPQSPKFEILDVFKKFNNIISIRCV